MTLKKTKKTKSKFNSKFEYVIVFLFFLLIVQREWPAVTVDRLFCWLVAPVKERQLLGLTDLGFVLELV